ncbi:hypothetical protein HELRODRAFT_83131, partial [Helobdella robusta]|uniref:Transcriptional activator protein Pur-alpha n=1 Tax=Helobdella robusta TaxID=6412 RepID=T1G507_HELRO
EEELASKTIQIQSKRFYIDVKQNKRGRFIKMAEVDVSGRKKRLVFSMATASVFRDKLSIFADYYTGLEHPEMDDTGTLKSEFINKDERRFYYLDLKENSRGRYLRVAMTIPLSRQRFQIGIPAQGMIEIRDSLTELLKEFGDYTCDDSSMPGARQLKVDNKMFYFDIGQNKRGTYMRISEVRSNFRTAITIPEKSWVKFRNIVADFSDDLSAPTTATSSNKLDKEVKVKVESPEVIAVN